MNTTTGIKTLADLIAQHDMDRATLVSQAVVTPASGGFGMTELGEISSEVYFDVRDFASHLRDNEVDPESLAVAEDMDGTTYNQDAFTMFRDESGDLFAIRLTSLRSTAAAADFCGGSIEDDKADLAAHASQLDSEIRVLAKCAFEMQEQVNRASALEDYSFITLKEFEDYYAALAEDLKA